MGKVKSEEYVDVMEQELVEPASEESAEEKVSKHEAYLESLRKAKELSKKTKEEFKKADYRLLRNDCYAKMDTVISMLKHDVAISGIIYGKGGTGKTHRTKQLLKDQNYEIIMTKLTPKALYCLLYEYRDADIIWFDDVTKIMKDPLILGFLKSICGDGNSEASKKRTVQYNVSTPIKNAEGEILPDNFEVSAKILITTNEMPNGKNNNLDLGAVLSRMKKAKLDIPRAELLKIFEEIIQDEYGGLSLAERREVFEYLKANTNDKMDKLNLRMLFDGFDYYRIAKIDKQGEQWKLNILEDLDRDPTIIFLEALLQEEYKFYNETERIIAFNDWLVKQGKKPISKATYYRMKDKLVKDFGLEPAEYIEKTVEASP